MNSRQRRKADRAYKILKDFVVIRLKLNGEVSNDELGIFLSQKNFLYHRLPPKGSYWVHLTPAARSIGVSQFVKAQTCVKTTAAS